ncbi:MAG: DMT family transporter [Candidatus Dormibacteraeota bacterium]|nr:DMT family transporter [Candidatus Dormibacteraeota bacterium]
MTLNGDFGIPGAEAAASRALRPAGSRDDYHLERQRGVVRVALQGSGPLTYSALRYMVGGIALLLLGRFLDVPLRVRLRRDRWPLVVLAASGVLVTQSSFTGSLALTNADTVAMIASTTSVLVAMWFARRSPGRFRGLVWLGFGLGLLGRGRVFGAGHWSGLLGIGIALLYPISWAVYLILLPRLLGRYRPLTLASLITVLGAVMPGPLGSRPDGGEPAVSERAPWIGLLAYSSAGAVALTTWRYLPGGRRLGPAGTAV